MRVFHSELIRAVRSMPDLRSSIRRGANRPGSTAAATLACRFLFALGEPGATLQKTADISCISFRRARRILNFAERYFNEHAGDAKSAEDLVAGFVAALPAGRPGRRPTPPDRRSQVLAMARVPGRTVRWIAKETKLSPATVSRILSSAARRARPSLETR